MEELLQQLIECNQWRFIGRLGADPEIRYFESGTSVCNARLLVNKPGQKRDDGQKPHSFKLELWRDKAQAFADAARKGDLVSAQGLVRVETWTDRNTGEEHRAVVVTVERYEVLLKAGQGQQTAAPAPQSQPSYPRAEGYTAWAGAAPAPVPAAKPAPSAWGGGPVSDEEVPF